MFDKKIILSIASIAIIYSGCGDEKSTQVEKHVTEKKSEVVIDKKVDTSTKNIEKVKNEIQKPQVEKIVNKVEKIVSVSSDTLLFKKCAGCHGATAEKSALGKSKIIKGWKPSKIIHAINGYKDGSYGGAMKGLMKSQVSSLSDKDIKSIATLISKF